MLTSEIRRKFVAYMDSWSSNWNSTNLTDIFSRANDAYWTRLYDRWGLDMQNDLELQPVTISLSLTPSTNEIPLTDLPEYNRIGYLLPTFSVSGTTYTFPAKELDVANKNSVFSKGTVRYPRFYYLKDSIVLMPTLTPTNVDVIYLKNPPVIDFTIADYDVDITDRNVYGICDAALKQLGVTEREFDFAAATQQNIINNK